MIGQDETQERFHGYVKKNAGLAWRAVTAIEKGDARGLGRAMTEAQVHTWE